MFKHVIIKSKIRQLTNVPEDLFSLVFLNPEFSI